MLIVCIREVGRQCASVGSVAPPAGRVPGDADMDEPDVDRQPDPDAHSEGRLSVGMQRLVYFWRVTPMKYALLPDTIIA